MNPRTSMEFEDLDELLKIISSFPNLENDEQLQSEVTKILSTGDFDYELKDIADLIPSQIDELKLENARLQKENNQLYEINQFTYTLNKLMFTELLTLRRTHAMSCAEASTVIMRMKKIENLLNSKINNEMTVLRKKMLELRKEMDELKIEILQMKLDRKYQDQERRLRKAKTCTACIT